MGALVKKLCLLVAVAFVSSGVFAGTTDSAAGTWTTISDKDGKPRGVVKIIERSGRLQGRIIKTYPRPGDAGICRKCPGKLKGKPIKGLRIVWGMKKNGPLTWSSGKILDPKSGKIYRCKMTLDKSGKKLYVRGYVGVSLFGRTQTWIRR